MSKLEIIISLAVGQIAMVIAMLKRLPQNEKTRKWIVGLRARR